MPYGRPLISTERTAPSSSRRAHQRRTGSAASPLPSIVRSVRLRPLSIQKHVVVGDHRVPAVAATRRRAVARRASDRRSSSRPAVAVEAEPEDDRGRRRRSRFRRRWRAARSTAPGAAAARPTGSSVTGSSTETVDGSSPAGASQSLVTSSPPSSTTNELCGRGHRQPVRGEDLEVGAQAVRPAAEDQVQVAAGVGGDPARPVGAARQPRRRRR